MNVSTKVAVSTSLIVAVTGGVALTVALKGQADYQRREFRQTNIEALELLGLAVAPAVAEGRHERAQAALDNVANFPERFPDVESLEVLDREGRVLADLDPKRFNTRVEGAAVTRDLRLVKPGAIELEGERLAVAVPLRLTYPLGVMRARLTEQRLTAAIRDQQQSAALLLLGTLAVIAAALLAVHRRLVGARIARLAEAAGSLRAGQMSVRAVVEGQDEVAELGAAFNQMAGDLSIYTSDLERLVRERTQELEAANHRLEELATTDQLTKLHNRRHFEDSASHALEVARRNDRPFSVVVIDVDHFKSINDRFGHPLGDIVLRDVASVLRDTARASDLVARIGGEEFAVAMPEATADEAALAAERMRRALLGASHADAPELAGERITASFGVASYPDGGDRLSALLSAADRALYEAKRTGRNKVSIAPPSTPAS